MDALARDGVLQQVEDLSRDDFTKIDTNKGFKLED
jgi:hypothetical protein